MEKLVKFRIGEDLYNSVTITPLTERERKKKGEEKLSNIP